MTVGGVMTDGAHTFDYVNGAKSWSKVIPITIIGLARAHDLDLTPYPSARGWRDDTARGHLGL